jgi:hypothetical protein
MYNTNCARKIAIILVYYLICVRKQNFAVHFCNFNCVPVLAQIYQENIYTAVEEEVESIQNLVLFTQTHHLTSQIFSTGTVINRKPHADNIFNILHITYRVFLFINVGMF